MHLNRHLENLVKHVKAGNTESEKRVAESLLRRYSRKSDQVKILAALES
jgi:hypothetical protein